MAIIHIQNDPRYTWGEECDGWHFLERNDLSVIRERMPPGTSEQRHYHERSRQFFFILAGEGRMEVEGEVHMMKAGEGIEVEPGQAHQFSNQSDMDLHFLVISAPKSHTDRILTPPT